MKNILVKKINNRFSREILLPGSKSITLRDFVLAGLAKGESIIKYPAVCDDAVRMKEGLEKFGIKFVEIENGYKVIGGGGVFSKEEKEVFLGGSGISIRFLLAMSALCSGKTVFDGNESLRARPQGYLIKVLREMGAKIKAREEDYLPIEIIGGIINSDKVIMKGDKSSQYFSALMQVAPLLKNGLEIKIEGDLVSKPYIDVTINEMKKFGVKVENKNYESIVIKTQQYLPSEVVVEGDASGASYFMALATIHGGEITINNLSKNSQQGDLNFYKICEKLGAEIELTETYIKIKGPLGGKLKAAGAEINMEDMPDTAQTLMAIAPFIPGKTRITGLSTLKLKECDRLEAPKAELKKLGIDVETGVDYIEIGEKQDFSDIDLSSIMIDTYDDHRMAMSIAVLATKIDGLIINDPDCVKKSFPNFWDLLNTLY